MIQFISTKHLHALLLLILFGTNTPYYFTNLTEGQHCGVVDASIRSIDERDQ